ncbi:hypothetical protein QC761_0089420 [Podospora bellae-mahoneyi]|uniref:Uncharacterized protein n=1 Tax=Podospora bellae-mahoneyi TaxID=2093777 RepID=A0ABR0F971_9PEZI|nr:hypothetical protein QC761_0089420 [Podospora bellae-mahoneyi]
MLRASHQIIKLTSHRVYLDSFATTAAPLPKVTLVSCPWFPMPEAENQWILQPPADALINSTNMFALPTGNTDYITEK